MNRQQENLPGLLSDIRELIFSSRRAAAQSVDLLQVLANFEIGRRIVVLEQQGAERAEYGKALLKELAADLTVEFGNGFSKRNLLYMRQFYVTYRSRQIAQTVSAQFTLSWSHYVFLMGIKDGAERDFYEIETTSQGWSLRELKRQFNSGLYERLALSRDKDGIRKLAAEGQIVSRPEDFLKDPYVLEFLGFDEKTRRSMDLIDVVVAAEHV